jgi:hypothetical protein
MTAHKQRVQFVHHPQPRSYAGTPEVCPLDRDGVHEHAAGTSLRRLDRLDQTSIVTTQASTLGARTIQHP